MRCWRKEVLRQEDTHCEEMESYESELEGGGTSCFCLGVIDFAHRDTEHSKRLCMVDSIEKEDDDGLDVMIDLTDVDVAALQATLSGGMLNIYQRARTMGAGNDDHVHG